MTAREISARAGTDENAPSATVQYDFGDDLDGAVELFGADVVFNKFVAASTVDLQAMIRRALSKEEPDDEETIQEAVSEWKPGVSTRKRKSAKEKAAEALEALSDEDRAALLAALTA